MATETHEEIAIRARKMNKGIEEIKRIRMNWLKSPEMLPKVIPSARIMRVGYESHWFGETAVNQ